MCLLVLCSCGQRAELAPVVESRWREVNSHAKRHTVVRGETLYSIAFRYDQDYQQLATFNHLHSPYTVKVGQVLSLQPVTIAMPVVAPLRGRSYKSAIPPQKKTPQPTICRPKNNHIGWIWPIHGKVVAMYSPQKGKKGIDIAGKKGEVIHAANGGVVAYAGSGLAGYGNLIIIKHDNQYLTAYGNNLKNLVKEGQRIRAGQIIAEIGVVDRRYWGVHFEIRKSGIPVNPLDYLKNG